MHIGCQPRAGPAVRVQGAAKAGCPLKPAAQVCAQRGSTNKEQLFLGAGPQDTEGGPSGVDAALRPNAAPVNMGSFI